MSETTSVSDDTTPDDNLPVTPLTIITTLITWLGIIMLIVACATSFKWDYRYMFLFGEVEMLVAVLQAFLAGTRSGWWRKLGIWTSVFGFTTATLCFVIVLYLFIAGSAHY